MIPEELEDQFDLATAAIEGGIQDLLGPEKISLEDVTEIGLTHFLIFVLPGIGIRETEGGYVHYEVDNDAASLLGGAAQSLPEALDVMVEVCAMNTFVGAPLPDALRSNAAMLIRGNFPGAKARGARPSKDFVMKFLLRQSALSVRDVFGLSLTRNAESENTLSACDAVSMVVERHGLTVPYRRLSEWCTHADHQGFRNRADAMWNHLLDTFLIKTGALKKSSTPFGPFQELSRMRG
ncbi:hypothetical protein Q5Y75_07965 [Ruegeria sp. 2205SS24-7]|uniref:hypothetical protein n=1 Tax=Ruegeria discodermiae TaxID=3064389 RepID=UPI002741AA4E|nr:hypothetical protein [Ruegeria sp. 2205SS24-7]MDP5217149.1 hypothetical protein [Ruegeria sp. 2205SS24-7]